MCEKDDHDVRMIHDAFSKPVPEKKSGEFPSRKTVLDWMKRGREIRTKEAKMAAT
jgi:hypothetical protein